MSNAVRTIPLKKVMIKFIGEYDSSVNYGYADSITCNGSSYVSKVDNNLGNPVTDTSKWFKVAEKGDTYQVSEEDLQNIENRITSDANSKFNKNVDEKTKEFNANAESKTSDYDDNASTKLKKYNDNHTEKLKAYNKNDSDAVSAYNTNASNKTSDFDTNASQKTSAFDENATSKTNEYNSNAATKTQEFNDNANSMLIMLGLDTNTYDETVNYSYKDKVVYNHILFESQAFDNVGNIPTTNSEYWRVVPILESEEE